MGTTTPTLQIPYPVESDSADIPRDLGAMATVLDAVSFFSRGLAGSRPAAGKPGRRYYETDTGKENLDLGTSWVYVTPVLGAGSVPGSALADGGVTDAKIASGINGSKVSDGTLGTSKYADASVTAAKIVAALFPSQGAGNAAEAFRAIGAGAGQVLAGNDSRVSGAIQSGAAAGGDLAGTLPNAYVKKILGDRFISGAGTAGSSFTDRFVKPTGVYGDRQTRMMRNTAFTANPRQLILFRKARDTAAWDGSHPVEIIIRTGVQQPSMTRCLFTSGQTGAPALIILESVGAKPIIPTVDGEVTVSGTIKSTQVRANVPANEMVTVEVTHGCTEHAEPFTSAGQIAFDGTETDNAGGGAYYDGTTGLTPGGQSGDLAAAIPSRRSLGTGAQQAAAGNDTRITGAIQTGAAAGGDLNGTYPNPSVAVNSELAEIENTTLNQTVASSADADITGLSISFTVPTTKPALVRLYLPATQQLTATGGVVVKLTDGSNNELSRAATTVTTNSFWGGIVVEARFAANAGAKTVKARISTSAGSVVVTSAATYAARLVAESR